MIFWICFSIIFLPVIILCPTKLIGRKNFNLKHNVFPTVDRTAGAVASAAARGVEKKKMGAVLATNHYSNLDVILLDIKLRRKIRYLAKAELFRSKVGGFFIRQFGGIKITRGVADPAAIKESLRLLKQGKVLGVFPEGTRNKNSDELLEVHNGAVVLAARAGVPIIPAIIYRHPKVFRRNIIKVGRPFMVESEIPRKPTQEEVSAATVKLVRELEGLRMDLDAKYKKDSKAINFAN